MNYFNLFATNKKIELITLNFDYMTLGMSLNTQNDGFVFISRYYHVLGFLLQIFT